VNQREIGVDVPEFKEGIRRALRMDPDVILVGEMRDLETIHAAIEAAETGHIVFATLHTSGASSTINRIIDVFPQDQQDQIRTQLSTALMGVLSQALLPRKPEGMIAAYEMMVVTPAIANLIRENKVYRIDSSIQTGRKDGMFLLDDTLFRLWKEDLCEKEEVLLKSPKPAELAAKIAQAERGMMDDDEDDFDDEEIDDEDDEDDDDEEDDRRRRRR
jgi:twitching motility protein PilT